MKAVWTLFCLLAFLGEALASRDSKRRRGDFENYRGENQAISVKRDKNEHAELLLQGLRESNLTPFMKLISRDGVQIGTILKVAKDLIEVDDVSSIELILNSKLIPIYHRDRLCIDIFDAAYRSKSLNILAFLLVHDKNIFLRQRPDSASLAVLANNFALAEIFIQSGFTIRRISERDIHPLFHAISKDVFSTVRLIVQKFPDLISICERLGRNVLFYAESAEMVALLLSFGAKAGELDSNRSSPFNYHLLSGRPSVARSILPLAKRFQHLIGIRGNALSKEVQLNTPRNNLLENAFYATFPTLRRNNFSFVPKIKFFGENAFDFGGLFRDWASAIAERLFQAPLPQAQESAAAATLGAFINQSPQSSVIVRPVCVVDFKLFKEAPFVQNDDKLFIPNVKFDGPEEVYTFFGYFMAICLLKKVSFGVRLAPSILKRILGLHLNFEDLRDDESQIYKSLLDLRAPNFDFDAAEIYFPSNLDLKVNRANLEVFLNERAKAIMMRRHQKRLNDIELAFTKALNCQGSRLRAHLNWQELSDLFYGEPELSAADLKSGMIMSPSIGGNDALIEKLFFAIDSMNQSALRKLIKFITGNENLPFGGAKALDQPIFVDESVDDNFRAGTCFFNFYIPTQVESGEEFLERLLAAIFSIDGFEDGSYLIGCCF